MGLFDRIFGNRKPSTSFKHNDYKALTAYQPVFTDYNGQIYESELVRAAIHAKATHISKLKVEFYGHGAEALSKRLVRPNAFQTWGQFLYRLATIYEVDNTAFIVPRFDRFGRIVEIYPILPSQSKMVEVNGEPWLAFQFNTGNFAQLPVWQVGVMPKFQYKNDYFGETNRAISPTMELIDIQNQGIKEGIKSAATYRFMAQYNNVAFSDDLEKEQERFNSRASTNGGMALLFPKTYENIQQIDSKPFVVDDKQMEQIRQNVFNYFGVNENVLQNKAHGDEWSAFYEGAVEPFSVQFSDVMTRMFVLCGELNGDCGVIATANRIQMMNFKDKIEYIQQMGDRGFISINEGRDVFNLAPVEGGDARVIRGEYYNADNKVSAEEPQNNSEEVAENAD